ncbi:MAG: M23 family metallopeptidase [Deltaproteobacteria bacterium]|nr:M23 family metallopeptidase [Deltaproteobacteria bacterium]
MDKRFFTLFVLTNDASKTRQFRLPFRSLKIAGAVSGLFALLLAFVLFDYARLKTTDMEYGPMASSEQKLALQGFASRIKELEGQLAKLSLFDKKIRIIANLEKEPRPAGQAEHQLLGMGGDSVVEEEMFTRPGAKVGELVDKMRSDLMNLEHIASTQEESFTELKDYLAKRSVMLASTPSILPAKGWVTSNYGSRVSPFTGTPQHHTGMDIANRIGTPVSASADGIVVQAGKDASLGKFVVISHGYGIKTTYGHLSELSVNAGQKVKRGAQIGQMGNTGRSTGPHLHYAVSVNGLNVNPEKYIVD